MTRSAESSSVLAQFAAPVFVILWSTGFIGAKFGLPYAEPMTFLSIRFMLAFVLLLLWAAVSRASWPSLREAGHLLLVGAMLHGGYLGGVFAAIWLGIEAGMSALIVSMQPILTAVLARWMLGERMTGVQWAGLALGLAGVTLVLWRKLGAGLGDAQGVVLCIGALAAISVATLYQKRYCADAPMRAGAAVQYLGGFVVVMMAAFIFETGEVNWTAEFLFALGWLVLVLSIGAVGLLMAMIRRGAASKVASLFFLVPPCTAVIAWLMFGETLGSLAIAGMILAAAGVALVMRGGQTAA